MSASQYPPEESGNHEWGFIVDNGQIVVRFDKPIDWAKLDPANAIGIGNHLLRLAFNIKYGRDPEPGELARPPDMDRFTHISDVRRNLLVMRLVRMIPSENFQARSLMWQAQQIVDTIMAELA